MIDIHQLTLELLNAVFSTKNRPFRIKKSSEICGGETYQSVDPAPVRWRKETTGGQNVEYGQGYYSLQR